MTSVLARKIVCDYPNCKAEMVDPFPQTPVRAFRVELQSKGWSSPSWAKHADMCPKHREKEATR